MWLKCPHVWVLFVIWTIFYLLYFNIFTTTRSAMSKLMDPTEIGKAFSVLGVLEACLALVAKPLYGFMYQASLDIFAGLWMVVSVGFLLIALLIAIILHCGMKSHQKMSHRTNDRLCMKMILKYKCPKIKALDWNFFALAMFL